MDLEWTHGFNLNMDCGGLHAFRGRVFYTAGCVGVVHDFQTNSQESLRGHSNKIECTAMSKNAKWIVTSDVGPNCLVIVWDTDKDGNNESHSIVPIRVIADVHDGKGAISVCFSQDGRWLFTLGANSPQTLCIWDWTVEASDPVYSVQLNISEQINIRMNPSEPFEFLTYGRKVTMFYSWSSTEGIVQKSPLTNEKNLEYELDNITSSIFFNYEKEDLGHQAMSILAKGDVIVWQNRNFVDLQKKLPDGQRAALQVTKIQSSNITFIENFDDGEHRYFITGSTTGQIYVFDMDLRLMWWYNLSKSAQIPFCGSIKQITTDPAQKQKGQFPNLYAMTSLGQLFLIKTEQAKVQDLLSQHNVNKKKRVKEQFKLIAYEDETTHENLHLDASTQCVLDFPFSTISCIQVSPTDPHIIVAGESGFVRIWNYETRSMVKSITCQLGERAYKPFQKEAAMKITKYPVTAMSIDPSGRLLVLAIQEPHCTYLFYNAQTLELVQKLVQYPDIKVDAHVYSLAFSPESDYIAAIDSGHGTSILKKDENDHWYVLGKVNAHHANVITLEFVHRRVGEEGSFKKQPFSTLYSICEDGFAIEYNVHESKIETGLVIQGIRQLERLFSPTCTAVEIEKREDEEHERMSILMANTDFKIRSLNADTLFIRKTCLGPGALYGTLKKMQVLFKHKYLAYATDRRVLGLIKLPIDGNMYKSVGVISHGKDIEYLLASNDGKYLFSASKNILHTWKLDLDDFEHEISQPTPDPFMEILESEANPGQSRYKELEDHFYYTQIKEQGETSKEDYKVRSSIPLKCIPDIMRAMGYFPSEEEVENMLNEVRFSKVGISGQLVDEIDMKGLVKLYVNHKPVVPNYEKQDIQEAISRMSELTTNLEEADSHEIQINLIKKFLAENGESMALNEFDEIAQVLKIKSENSTLEDLSKVLMASN